MDKEEYDNMYRLEDSHWWYVGMRGQALRLMNDLYGSRRNLAILDAGCGTGGTLPHLARYGEATGLDFCEDALAFCRRRGLRRLVQGSVLDVPFRDGSFDLVVSFEVLYHRAVTDDEAALREFYRVLRPDGHLLIRLPAHNWLRGGHDEVVHTRSRYSASEVRQKMRRAGFRVERASYANSLLFPIAALKRASEMALKRSGTSDVKPTAPWLNRVLTAELGIEARFLRQTDLPWGLSIVALGSKESP